MTNTPRCTFAGDRDAALVEYLYAEPDSPASGAFAAHLDGCAACRAELDAFGGVRRALSGWAPPEPIRALEPALPRVGPRLAPPPADTRPDGWRAMPVWAQAAAAVLCVGLALGAANLRVRVGDEGLTVSTGWLTPDEPPVSPASAADAGAVGGTPWRTDLTALEERLRGEIRQQPAPALAAADPGSADAQDEALLRRIRTLIAQSEQRQQRELALRIGDAMTDMQSQRRADLSRIDRTIGLIQNNTGMEVLRQREMLNSLAVRVSGQR